MKLSDFSDKSAEFKPQPTQILAFNNEVKEAEMASKIASLEEKIRFVEQNAEEKAVILGKLGTQTEENSLLVRQITDFEAERADFQAQLQDKERILADLSSLRQQNDSLLVTHGEITANMGIIQADYHKAVTELDQLRINNANLEIEKQSLYNEGIGKDSLISEFTSAMTMLKEQHAELLGASDDLRKQYTEVTDNNKELGRNNVKLADDLRFLKSEREEFSSQSQYNINKREKAVEERMRDMFNGQIEELHQDVAELSKLNGYYRSELSKPQHMSIGSIARQEGFKIPLASHAINFRKNNLGTGHPTLLKFGSKENNL